MLGNGNVGSETAPLGIHTPTQACLLKQPSPFPGALGVSPTDSASPTWTDLSRAWEIWARWEQGFPGSDPGIGDEVRESFSLGFMKQIGFGGRDTENRKYLRIHSYIHITYPKEKKNGWPLRAGSRHLFTWKTAVAGTYNPEYTDYV